jgi:hypothetical protein
MVPAVAKVAIAFSEPVVGLGSAGVQLSVNGAPLTARTTIGTDLRSVVLRPNDVLPTNVQVSVSLDAAVRDAAGNPPAASTWTFRTAPGRAYDPWRAGQLAVGTRVGYDIGAEGDLLVRQAATLGTVRNVSFAQRALMPNLPGRWLYSVSGPLARRWVRESNAQHIDGFVERTTYGTTQPILLLKGAHVGFRFSSGGQVLRSKRVTLRRGLRAGSTVRAVINGATWWWLDGGVLDGFWVQESGMTRRRGIIDEIRFAAPPRIDVLPGTYVLAQYDRRGGRGYWITAVVGTRTAVRVSAWAVINGTPRYLVSSGPWAGLWLTESSATRLHV